MTGEDQDAATEAGEDVSVDGTSYGRGEHRWPMAAAVLFLMVLPRLVPNHLTLAPTWLFPVLEGALLITLLFGDPGRINRRARWLRVLSLLLVAVLVAGVGWATVRLIVDLIQGSSELDSANALLATGALVWIGNTVAFGLLYWELDAGGPANRLFTRPVHPDFAFPQQLAPELAPPGWRARFPDYLYLGFTNATAFSPTDAMPLTHWAKLAMTVQSLVSIVLLSLVIARAVNILT